MAVVGKKDYKDSLQKGLVEVAKIKATRQIEPRSFHESDQANAFSVFLVGESSHIQV